MKAWLQKIKNLLPTRTKKTASKIADIADDLSDEQVVWWGTFIVEEEQSRFFKIGNMVLCLDRFNHEWHITTYREGEQPLKTFAAQASNEILLKPTLPNRALLSRLDRPFYVPTGETLLLYISTPVWIRIEAGSPPIVLDEVTTETLPDTWFGKNTLEGELCYANNTLCSARLEDLPRDITHVITPISIENRSKETLLLQELKIPLLYLSVYSDLQNHLWTEPLNLYQEDFNHVEISVIKGPPQSLKVPQLVSPARISLKSGFKDLFSPFMWK